MENSGRTRSRIGLTLNRLLRNRIGLIGVIALIILALLGVLAPLIAPYNPNLIYYGEERLPPSIPHLFGTDTLGKDVFSFCLWGIRTSFLIGFGALAVELALGLVAGGTAGYFGGWVDNVIMRIADIVMSLPVLILMILAISMFQAAKETTITILMGSLSWPWIARVFRSEILSLRESEFVEAAKGMGASMRRVLIHHLLPNALSPVIVVSTIEVAEFIIWEASLAFLGVGDPTAMSLGNLLLSGKNIMFSHWWISFFPGLILFIMTLSLNLFGDGLRDALDVRVQ